MTPKGYLTIYHHDTSVKTLSELMEKERIVGVKLDELFDYNRDAIFNQMSPTEKAAYAKKLGKDSITSDDIKSDMTLPIPCTLHVKAEYVTQELAISQTNFEIQTDNIYAFQNEQISNIVQNEGYVNKDYDVKRTAPQCSVFGWFKSKYYVGEYDGDNKWAGRIKSENNKFMDISDYIVNLTTNVTPNGGNFQITLPIINSIEDFVKVNPHADSPLAIERGLSYTDRLAKPLDVYRFGKHFYHKAGMVAMEQNFFNWLIQSNDLIFIAFETLEMEKMLGGHVFDMIGLVDSVVVTQNANGQGSVTVSGRDLMKLLTDDSSLFFNASTVWGQSEIFANTESAGKQGDIVNADAYGDKANPIDRLRRSTNEIDVFANPFNRTIDFVMKGVVSQLANIEVVPSYVFEGWGDRRTRFTELYPEVSSDTSGVAKGGAGGGSGEGIPQLNTKDFDSGIGGNANKDQYTPIKGGGGSGGSGNVGGDVPAVPRIGSKEQIYEMHDGMMIRIDDKPSGGGSSSGIRNGGKINWI